MPILGECKVIRCLLYARGHMHVRCTVFSSLVLFCVSTLPLAAGGQGFGTPEDEGGRGGLKVAKF